MVFRDFRGIRWECFFCSFLGETPSRPRRGGRLKSASLLSAASKQSCKHDAAVNLHSTQYQRPARRIIRSTEKADPSDSDLGAPRFRLKVDCAKCTSTPTDSKYVKAGSVSSHIGFVTPGSTKVSNRRPPRLCRKVLGHAAALFRRFAITQLLKQLSSADP